MVTSVEQPESPSLDGRLKTDDGQLTTAQNLLTSRKNRSLLMMAVLAGMAAAAVIVLLLALRPAAGSIPAHPNLPVPTGRPSPFGAIPSVSPPDVKLTPWQIAKAGKSAVLRVTGYDANDQPLSSANGYVYSPNGIIVTTYSAIRGASSVEIDSATGEELTVIALMGYSPARDLAALAVLEGNLASLESGASETLQEGEPIVAIGSDRVVSQGTVGPRRALGGVDLIQINAQAATGSPVVNQHGKVVGLIVSRALGGVFAIPSHYISDLLAEHRTISFAQMLNETGQVSPLFTAHPDP